MADRRYVGELLSRVRKHDERPACFWQGQETSYSNLADAVNDWERDLEARSIGAGSIVGVLADYSPRSVSLLLALMHRGAILVPFSKAVEQEVSTLADLASVRWLFRFDSDDGFQVEHRQVGEPCELIASFLPQGDAGLIVFTSGSTGEPKGILHDCERLVKKFAQTRRAWRTLMFLLFDHFGGFNTLLAVLSYGGTMVMLSERGPVGVAKMIEAGRVELLPVTPTLLNLLLASGAGEQHDLASVRLVTYGTEVMTEATLKGIKGVFPEARLQQTYGLSELGVLRSKSRSSDSLWVKVGGDGFETKVEDGLLWVRSESAMLGYLNAPSPYDDNGWMCTGDHVEQDGEYIHILGRESDVINVGGQKVFPAEVETVLLDAANVEDATAFGESHPLMGFVVHARVRLAVPEPRSELRKRLRRHCLASLAAFKVPVRFEVTTEQQHNERFKKVRPALDAPSAT